MSDPKSPPTYAPDERQPQSAVDERAALSEREDGVNRGGADDLGGPDPNAVPLAELTADERQALGASAERAAESEREDGTNRG